MASIINKNNLSYLTFTNSFDRTFGQPLDPTSIYSSLGEAQDYAKTDKAYVGQIISVVTASGVDHYSIKNEDGILEKIGSADSPTGEVSGVGKATDAGGEIFNDYENNKSYSPYSSAKGTNSTAGSNAFQFAEHEYISEDGEHGKTGKYYLTSVEGIAVKDQYTIVLQNNFDYQGTVQSIDSSEKSITVNNYLFPYADTIYAISNKSYIHFPKRPDLGTISIGDSAVSEGDQTKATSFSSHSEGYLTNASGKYSHAEGRETISGYSSHSEGRGTQAIGEVSHAEGYKSVAVGPRSHAEGANTSGGSRACSVVGVNPDKKQLNLDYIYSISNGDPFCCTLCYQQETDGPIKTITFSGTITTANSGFVRVDNFPEEASYFVAVDFLNDSGVDTGANSLCVPTKTTVGWRKIGYAAHAEGSNTLAIGYASHAGGSNTYATANNSFAHGHTLTTSKDSQAVFGRFNADNSDALFIVGSGTDDANRANAFEIIQDSSTNEVSLKIGSVTLSDTQLKNLGNLLSIDSDKLQQLFELLEIMNISEAPTSSI